MHSRGTLYDVKLYEVEPSGVSFTLPQEVSPRYINAYRMMYVKFKSFIIPHRVTRNDRVKHTEKIKINDIDHRLPFTGILSIGKVITPLTQSRTCLLAAKSASEEHFLNIREGCSLKLLQ